MEQKSLKTIKIIKPKKKIKGFGYTGKVISYPLNLEGSHPIR
jgi:hypothetical protein